MRCMLFAVLAVAAVLRLCAADPYVGYVYPAGMQAGTTNRLVVGGQFFWNILGGDAGEGVRVLGIEPVPRFPVPARDQRRHLVAWLDRLAKGVREPPPLPAEGVRLDEWHSNSWYAALGDLDAGKRALVERFLHEPRNALQMSPALGQRLLVTVAVDADAVPGVREFRVYNARGVSPPRPFLVSAAPHLAEPLYVPPHRKQPAPPVVARVPCVLEGQILTGQQDRWTLPLAKGETVTLRAVARELQPYIGDAVPGFFNPVLRVYDREGRECAFADDYYHHPDPVLTFTAPDDGDYAVVVHDNLYRGRDDFTYLLDVRRGVWRPPLFDLSLSPPPPWEIPSSDLVRVFRGTIRAPGRGARHRLSVSEPGAYVFDLLARRVGSPLDARVTAWRGGEKLADVGDVANDVSCGSVMQAACDPIGRVWLDRPGTYEFRVEDEAGLGGADYAYSLRLSRPRPRCEVWCLKSGLAFSGGRGGRRVGFRVVRRDGFDGAVRLEENDFVAFRPNVVPAASNEVVVTAVCKIRGPCVLPHVAFTASFVRDGLSVETPVIPADVYNQAFAWDHLLPARRFLLAVPPDPTPRRKK